MNNYQRTAAWLAACGKEPSSKNLSIQIGCHLEEMIELLECLELDCREDENTLNCIIDGQQQTPSGGTNGGTSETQTS